MTRTILANRTNCNVGRASGELHVDTLRECFTFYDHILRIVFLRAVFPYDLIAYLPNDENVLQLAH